MIRLYDQTGNIDMVQLNSALTDRKMIDQIGGLDYLLELMEAVPSAAAAEHYAALVRKSAKRRQLIDAAGRALHAAHNDPDIDAVHEQAEQALFALGQAEHRNQAVGLSSLLAETMAALENHDGAHAGLETGYYELDEMTSGMGVGDLIILAARPSIGKTAFALNIAEHVGATGKLPCVVFSLEMSRQQLAQRLLCARSRVSLHALRRNMLSRDDFARLQQSTGELSDSPILIDDTPGLSAMQLRAKARRLASRHDLKLIVVDYIQLMTSPGAENRQTEVSAISRGLKALARELSCPVLALSQLNRKNEDRGDRKPRMSDLRESGSLEQDADAVLLLHREDYYHQADPDISKPTSRN